MSRTLSGLTILRHPNILASWKYGSIRHLNKSPSSSKRWPAVVFEALKKLRRVRCRLGKRVSAAASNFSLTWRLPKPPSRGGEGRQLDSSDSMRAFFDEVGQRNRARMRSK